MRIPELGDGYDRAAPGGPAPSDAATRGNAFSDVVALQRSGAANGNAAPAGAADGTTRTTDTTAPAADARHGNAAANVGTPTAKRLSTDQVLARELHNQPQRVAKALARMPDQQAAGLFKKMSNDQLETLFRAAAGYKRDAEPAVTMNQHPTEEQDKDFEGLLAAADRIDDKNTRTRVMGKAADALRPMGNRGNHGNHGTISPTKLARRANSTLRALDGAPISPQQLAGLTAAALKGTPKDLGNTVAKLSSQPPRRSATSRCAPCS